MEQFLDATTVHGFIYIHRRNSFCARIFWSTIIIVGFSIAGYQIHSFFVDWDTNQTITTLESIAAPIQDVQFPTVTVHSALMVNLIKLFQKRKQLLQHESTTPIESVITSFQILQIQN